MLLNPSHGKGSVLFKCDGNAAADDGGGDVDVRVSVSMGNDLLASGLRDNVERLPLTLT